MTKYTAEVILKVKREFSAKDEDTAKLLIQHAFNHLDVSVVGWTEEVARRDLRVIREE